MTNVTISDIGYHATHVDMLAAAARRAHGLVVFAGVSGSRKTAAQRALAEASVADGGSVFYLDQSAKLPRDQGKPRDVIDWLLRCSPDVVVAGDVRDRSDGELLLRLIGTGHKVTGSVSAHTLKGIVPRLTGEQVGMSRQFLTSPGAISLLAYQALVKKTCVHCSVGVSEVLRDDESWDACKHIIASLEQRFKLDVQAARFRRIGGCSRCEKRGWTGVKLIAEMFVPDATWLEMSRHGDDQAAHGYWRSHSDRRLDSPVVAGKTAFEQCLFFALKGVVDLRECLAFEQFENYSPLH